MKKRVTMAACLALLAASSAMAAGVIVYPAEGQSEEQQRADKGHCMSWASEETGFDPTAPVQTTSAPPPDAEPTTGAGRGALRGALGGLAIGAIAGDAGKGAAIGAGTGAVVGASRRNRQEREAEAEQEQWANEQATQYQSSQSDFNRAYSACMTGRGYTVN